MVLTRSQYEDMSKEELIQELSDIKSSFINGINAKLAGLLETFNEFTSKYDNVYLESQHCKSFNYITIEVNPVRAEIQDDILEASVCEVLSLTAVNIAPEDLHACHRMKRLDRVIVKFKCCKQKQSVVYNRKNLGTKSQELSNFNFWGRLFVSESMSLENQQLAYRC